MNRLLLLVMLASTGCQWSEDRYARRDVAADELHGTWRATPFAVTSWRDVGVKEHLTQADHELVFRSDGTCTVATFFRLPPLGSDAHYRQIENDCRWTLTAGPRQQLRVEAASESLMYHFDDSEDKLIIWQYATDPDSRKYSEFEKVGSS
jgi:hypothetical protein